jgi:hypothetical protein
MNKIAKGITIALGSAALFLGGYFLGKTRNAETYKVAIYQVPGEIRSVYLSNNKSQDSICITGEPAGFVATSNNFEYIQKSRTWEDFSTTVMNEAKGKLGKSLEIVVEEPASTGQEKK